MRTNIKYFVIFTFWKFTNTVRCIVKPQSPGRFSFAWRLKTQPNSWSDSAVKIPTSLPAAGDWTIVCPSWMNGVLILPYLFPAAFLSCSVLFLLFSCFALSDVTRPTLCVHISSYHAAFWLLPCPSFNFLESGCLNFSNLNHSSTAPDMQYSILWPKLIFTCSCTHFSIFPIL